MKRIHQSTSRFRTIYFHAILITLISFTNTIFAQDAERPNTVNTRLFPTYNSDFSYFFLRRNMNMYEQMTSAETIIHQDGAVDIRTKLFIPLFKNDKWSYSIPIYFDRYEFIGESEDQRLSVSNLFGQSLLTYHPHSKWDISHIIEFRFKGANDHFVKKEGNFIAQFVTTQYHLNSKFSVIGGFLMGIGWDNNRDSYLDVKPAVMLKWNPNKYLSVMAGVPGSAIEWSAPGGIDIMAHVLIDGNEFNTSAAIRKNFGEYFDITFRYLHEGFDKLYTPAESIETQSLSSSLDEFDQINQYQDKLQIELTVRPEKNTVLQLIGGYAQNRDLNLFDGDDKQISLISPDGYYFGINIARTIILKN